MLVIVVGYTCCVPRKGEPGGEKLREYRAKRDFAVTAEPEGAAADAGGARFVVQRHRARRLHYDFRLEVDGVLASWAVPRGPSLDPAARQLAVHVEDHPLEYADFEGVIPRGQYGGGDVIVWDRGTWTPAHTDDPATAIRDGELHFDLTGEKLAGRFALIRRGRTGSAGSRRTNGCSSTRTTSTPGTAGPPTTTRVRCSAAARTTRSPPPRTPCGRAACRLRRPRSGWVRARGSRRPTTSWPPSTRSAATARGRSRAATSSSPTSTRCSSPGATASAPVTKRELVRHYATVGPLLLPYLAGRPVNLHRFPEGVDRQGFWQQELPAGTPDWVTRWHDDDPGPDTAEWRVLVDGVPTLAWLANLAAVELHPWTGRLPEVRRPAWALIDIDPGTRTTFDQVLVLARLFRTALGHLGVEGMPKVTGQRGIQIWVPVAPGYTYSDTRGWVEKVSKAVGSTVPELVSWEWTKDRRGGRARLDYTQNVVNKTLVAPWSVRPRAGAPVSVPITWEELDDPDLAPDRWTVRDVPDRIREAGDPLAPLIGRAQKLPSL